MSSQFRIAIFIALFLLLFIAVPVFAGGWAVVTLDELPVAATAGEPLTIGFTVLQHGKTPTTGLSPVITAILPKQEQFMVTASEEGEPGHYTATLIFPKEGDWNWHIDTFGVNQLMPTISVAAPVAVQAVEKYTSFSFLLVVRVLAFGAGLFGVIFALRSKNRPAMAITALCLVVGVASFIPASTVPEVEAQSGLSSESSSISPISQVEMGRRLFIAKGCITCHVNDKADQSDHWTVDMGAPNLSNFSASPEALRLRLKDPTLVKSDTQMPNLNLSEAEIEALIAFINSK